MNKPRKQAFPDMTQDRRWHLDRRVPMATIFAILLQTAGVIWWGSSLNERVNQLEAKAVVSQPLADRTTRMEVKIENIEKVVGRIEQIITTAPRK